MRNHKGEKHIYTGGIILVNDNPTSLYIDRLSHTAAACTLDISLHLIMSLHLR